MARDLSNPSSLSPDDARLLPSAASAISRIREVLLKARHQALIAVNTAMVQAYWDIGREIVEEEQRGQARGGYGQRLLESLSTELTEEFSKGFTPTNLKYMRQFYMALPIRHTLRDDLSWSHYRLLSRIDRTDARAFYEQESVAEGAVSLAEKLTTACNLIYPGRDLVRVASFQGAKIEECEMTDAGRLIPLPLGDFEFLIQVNAAHSRQRKNFSIAHEVGHTLVPDYCGSPVEKHDAYVMQWHDEHEEEFLCDVMASEILLPQRQLKLRLEKHGVTIDALHKLAEEFDTSLEATAVSIVRAGLDDVAVIVWTLGYNKEDAISAQSLSLFGDDPAYGRVKKKFLIKFAIGHGQMSEFFFPKNKSIEDDSLIAQSARHLAGGYEPRSSGTTTLTHGRSEQKFYVESRAYPTKNGEEWECKIVSIVFTRQPSG